jgi:hypothetical protein
LSLEALEGRPLNINKGLEILTNVEGIERCTFCVEM